ncbi:response regulator [Pedobacter mucosus]|uniref:response regulator n=1 Tax=Pedobacter mucosus TaxID=2895286 RepID=UPI001EE45130|nr:response regulator transcription factor [Pedobacter mucosus]UKT65629.1 response regulator transcription factor [Pedobacter mucosus]
MTQILLIEDELIQYDTVKEVIKTYPNLNLPFVAKDGNKAIEILQKRHIEVDIVLVPLELPHNDGIEITEKIRKIRPNLPVILLTSVYRTEHVIEAFKKGVNGFLSKEIKTHELIFAISHINDGGKYLSSELAEKLINKASVIFQPPQKKIDVINLGDKETRILSLIADGLTNFEIGSQLMMSKRTVEGIRKNMLIKTQTTNTAALVSFAYKNGILK